MHMADALLSPAVGGTMWVAAGGAIAWCSRRLTRDLEDRVLPLMGVLGAFVFTAQMINFAIPGAGSSGHLGGGLLLAILLGPCPAFLTMASILAVQALLFADGGILAFGCNLFNLGFLPCFVGYPIFRRLVGEASTPRLAIAAVAAATVTAQLGALAVALETAFSGISELPFRPFATLMLSIHLPIGIVEGMVTALIAGFLWKAKPEILPGLTTRPVGVGLDRVVAGLAVAAILMAGMLSCFSSSLPDGLEWSIMRVADTTDLSAAEEEVHTRLADLQAETAVLPDYHVRSAGGTAETPEPRRRAETGLAGLIGGLSTLLLTVILIWLLQSTKKYRRIRE